VNTRFTSLTRWLRHLARHSPIAKPLLWAPRQLRIWYKARRRRETEAVYSRVVVGGTLLVRPENIPAEVEINARSELALRIILTGEYEPEFTAAIANIPVPAGDTVINVGANIGLITLFAARNWPDANVVAVEPNPEAFVLLQRNIARAGLGGRVRALQACISRDESSVELAYVPNRSEYSSIGQIVHPATAGLETRKVAVRATTLGQADPEIRRIALVLIDTEGAEYLVLEGGRDVIRRDRPVIVLECEDRLMAKFGASAKATCALLEAEGYEVFNALFPEHRPNFPFEGELLAVPKERLAEVSLPASTR
jgi:FkbM family methyltransferase